jgi:DNA polymerase I-like protein with 3'-5' exonuclease and polymerase domains
MIQMRETVRLPSRTSVKLVDSWKEIQSELLRLASYGVDIGFDLETTRVDPINSKIVTIALKPRGKVALVIDVRRWYDSKESEDNFRLLGSLLSGLFDGSVTIVGQNLKFDLLFFLAQLGLAGYKVYDTMLAEQVILGLGVSSAAEKGIHFDLASIGARYGVEVHKEERSWFIDLDQRPEWNLPLPEEQLAYIRQDVSVVHKIKEAQVTAIELANLWEVIDLEMRALFPLVGIEHWGVQINRDGWLSVIDRVTEEMHGLERTLHLGSEDGTFEGLDVHVLKVRNERYMEKWGPYEVWMKGRDAIVAGAREHWDSHTRAGVELPSPNWSAFKKATLDWWYAENEKRDKPAGNKEGVNLGSWMQVRDGFNDLGIPVESVSEDTLEPYRGQHPLVGIYLDYVKDRKIITVYGREKKNGGPSFIDMLDGSSRMRASYQQIGADTGRMSSYRPNFQQIPEKGVGKELRKNVVAAPGYILVDADFSNIELRAIAELSGDKFLLDAFASGEDIHAYTAVVMWKLSVPAGVSAKEWTSSHDAVVGGRTLVGTSYRTIAKTINYMLLYGAGVKKLAGMLGISERDARTVLNTYYETFAQAIAWLSSQKSLLDAAKAAGEKRVFAQTRSGRRRWFDIPAHPPTPIGQMVPNHGSYGVIRLTVEQSDKWQKDMDEWRGRVASIKRQLANTPIQGLSADITKEAVARWYEVVGYDRDMRLVAVIHDELLVEAREDEVAVASSLLEGVMYWAMDKYLHVVDKGEVHAVRTPYWSH